MSHEAALHNHEGHGHDDHGHHEHHDTFLTKYVFSQDHKMIAKQFLITGMVWAVLGGLMSVLFRLQLGYPDANFPWLESILGKWAKGGQITPEAYYALVTTHGTVLVFFVLTAGLSGTFANFLIPLQIGARDMASPFMNMLSYWFFFTASMVMLSSLFVETGPFSGGWTAYPPLSALHDASPGSKTGMDLWLISMALFVVSSLLGGLNYIATILNMRTKGMTMTRLPLTIWALFFTAVLGVLSFPVLLSGLILLIFDRNFDTSFYLSDIFVNGVGALSNEGGSAILYQHLFWFLGHPEVYIILLPALGMVSEIISVNSRKPIFGYMAMLGSLFAIAILAFLVWAHHMFVTGLNPFLGSVFVLLTLLIAIPSGIKVFNWLTTLWRGNIRFTPGMLFAIGFVSLFISGGLTGIWLGNAALDIYLHDSYFVVAHFHIVMGLSAVLAMFAGVYHWYPKMFGRLLNKKLGYLHFWLTFVSAYGVFFPQHFQGLAGVPRRYYSWTEYPLFADFADLSILITIAAILGGLAQFIFLYNFIYSMYRGQKSPQNPWQSNTLEWTTPVKHFHGNWPGELPTVHRWPYDYSKPGKDQDFVPQTVPLEEGESDGESGH